MNSNIPRIIVNLTVVFLAVLLGLSLLTGFIVGSFDPSTWTPKARENLVFFSVVITALLTCM